MVKKEYSVGAAMQIQDLFVKKIDREIHGNEIEKENVGHSLVWGTNTTDINIDILEFSVFCVESVAERLGVSGEAVYHAFTKKSDLLDGYIIPLYEPLHTQGKEYIVDVLLEAMQEKGVEI